MLLEDVFVVPLDVRALVGCERDVEAWMEVEEAGRRVVERVRVDDLAGRFERNEAYVKGAVVPCA